MAKESSSKLKLLNRETVKVNGQYEPKVLQFGGGNFLRAYIDWMIQVLNEETDFKGGVVVVKPTEKGDYKDLRSQDGLFHLSSNGIHGGRLIHENKLITCIHRVIHPYLDWEGYLKTAELKSIKFIFSNTTEAGIIFNKNDKITYKPPKEFPAKLTHWLLHRFNYFSGHKSPGCIVLPCELIKNNGSKLKSCILQYAELWDLSEEFKNWIHKENIFCDTLVDRIVPGFPNARKEEIFNEIGFKDYLIVDAEPYHLLVIQSEQNILNDLPFHLTNLNVVFTENLEKYRKLKIRILNGLHTSMVPVAYLSGIESVREAVEDEIIGDFINRLLHEEILPILDFPEDELEKYAQETLDRFKNPYIHHLLLTISLNSISKFKTRVIPTLLDFYQKKNFLPGRIVQAFASLIWFYRGKRGSEIINLNDDTAILLFFRELWNKIELSHCTMEDLVEAILKKEEFWEMDLNTLPKLDEELVSHLKRFTINGYSII